MGKEKKSLDYQKPLFSNSATNSQKTIPLSLKTARELIDFLVKETQVAPMALHFVGERRIATLHNDYFDNPSPTDCITFPYDDPDFLGEVFVCPKVAADYVEQTGGDLSEEITLYVVHGFLHLLGYKDGTEEEKKEMRAKEGEWMDRLSEHQLKVCTR